MFLLPIKICIKLLTVLTDLYNCISFKNLMNSLLLKSVLKLSVIRQEGHYVLLYQNLKDLEILVITRSLNCVMLGLTLF